MMIFCNHIRVWNPVFLYAISIHSYNSKKIIRKRESLLVCEYQLIRVVC